MVKQKKKKNFKEGHLKDFLLTVSGSNLQNYLPVLAMGMILAILALSTGVLTVSTFNRSTYSTSAQTKDL